MEKTNVKSDQLSDFQRENCIPTFADIGNNCPLGFQVAKTEDVLTFYKKIFDDRNFFKLSTSTKICK